MDTVYTRKQPAPYDVVDRDDIYETRTPSSARRYKPRNTKETMPDPITEGAVPRRRSGASAKSTIDFSEIPQRRTSKTLRTKYEEPAPEPRKKSASSKRFFVTSLVIGMLVAIALLIGLSLISGWWQRFQDDLHYGNPRTSHLDAVVGHSDSPSNPTHFIFINLHGHIEIIEIPGGDTSHTRIFNGPTLYGPGQDLTPVTGEPVTDKSTGKVDILVHVGNQEFLMTNDGKTFHIK